MAERIGAPGRGDRRSSGLRAGAGPDRMRQRGRERNGEGHRGREPGTDVELDDDGVKVTDEEGNTSEFGTGADLPDGWPKAIPVPDGDVTFSTKSGEDFTVGITVDGSSQDVYDAWKSDLEGAGFTEKDTADFSGNYLGTFTGNGYDVGYTISSDPASDGKTAVILNVTAASLAGVASPRRAEAEPLH